MLILLLLSLVISSCGQGGGLKQHKESRQLFGTYITIKCIAHNDEDISIIIKKCWNRLEEIQEKMSLSSPKSLISEVNMLGLKGIDVDVDTYKLLLEAKKFSKLTSGAFDITVKPFSDLWRKSSEEGIIPNQKTIDLIKPAVGYENIILKEPSKVLFKNSQTKIDLGAIAKGYGIDEAAKILQKHGIKDFLIDAGGDIYCSGKQRDMRPWSIGVQDPFKGSSILDVLSLSNKAVTTSGDYQRFYIIEGKRFSHIIDPATGYPQESIVSATVIADSAMAADALSTALCVMKPEEGIALIEAHEGIEALIVEKNQGGAKSYQTKCFPRRK